MSGDSYSRGELTAIGAFTVASVLIGVGAYQLGFNLSGGRSVGAEMVAASAPAPASSSEPKKSPSSMCATWVLESALHAPIRCGCFFA